MATFRTSEMKQLAHELMMSPVRHRLRQRDGILRAIELLDPEKEYPYSFVCFHVTGYRPRKDSEFLLSGDALAADLVELLDVLTAAHPLAPDAAEGKLADAAELARKFNVSTKTISRWRPRGLAGAWYHANEDKPSLLFSERAVNIFVTAHLDLVRRGAAFKIMTGDEKADIVARARVIVAARNCSLHAATLEIARQTGRAVETIRYTLRRFDRDHPEEALFDRADEARPIDRASVLLEACEAGATEAELSERFNADRAEVRRLLLQAKVRRLADAPIDFIANPEFKQRDARERPAGRASASANNGRSEGPADVILSRTPSDLPAYLQALYRTPLLTADEERRLFAQMNFRLFQAESLRRRLVKSPDDVAERDLAELQSLLDDARDIKNRIIQANLRLVVSIAKRHAFGRPTLNLFELISDGNISLMRAVEKFDVARGFRFSTYATWAVTRGFARSVPDEIAHADRFRTGCDESLAQARDHRPPAEPQEEDAMEARQAVHATLKLLDERERAIVERHFGIGDEDGRRQTLDEIGKALGVSKERVRQIEMKALSKLRAGLGPHAAQLLAG